MVGELLRCKNKLIMVTCLWQETVYLPFGLACSPSNFPGATLWPCLKYQFSARLQSTLSKKDTFGTGSKCPFSRDVRLRPCLHGVGDPGLLG